MAKSKQSRNSGPSTRTAKPHGPDAIALLKADHRQVEKWFIEFDSSRSDARKADLAKRICQALKVHTQIEHEIFYPAFLEATQKKQIHHEAEVEHSGAKKLIAEIERSGPDDDYFEAKVTVLSEIIKHHVNEEEKRGGMFSAAKSSAMDLQMLGRQLEERKSGLMASSADELDEPDGEKGATKPERGRFGAVVRASGTR